MDCNVLREPIGKDTSYSTRHLKGSGLHENVLKIVYLFTSVAFTRAHFNQDVN